MTPTTTVANAVSQLNEQRQRETVAKAQDIVNAILAELAGIKVQQTAIDEAAKKLSAMVDVTPNTVLDRTLDPANPVQKVFADVIAKVQTDKVAPQALRLAQEIDERKDAIKAANTRIGELRAKAQELEAKVVQIADVMGQ